jgi:hypothetical protein
LGVPGLLEILSHRLNVPVEPFRPSEAFSCKLNGAAEQFDTGGTVALGLALKGVGQDSLDIDFRQEELKVANKFELLKNGLAVTVTLLFLGLLAFSAHCVLKSRELEGGPFDRVIDSAYKAFAPVTEKYNALGELVPASRRVSAPDIEREGLRPLAVRRFLSELERMRRHLHSIVGDAKGLPPITSALQVWNDLFEAIGKNHQALGYIDFEKIEITQNRVILVMVLPSAAAGEKLQGPLKTLPFLSELELEPDWNVQPITSTDFVRITFTFKRKDK